MYAVNYQSTLGPHLVNGPVNASARRHPGDSRQAVHHLAKAVGFSPDELPQNLYPITFPLDKGVPEYGQKVDVTPVSTRDVDVTTHAGKAKKVKARDARPISATTARSPGAPTAWTWPSRPPPPAARC